MKYSFFLIYYCCFVSVSTSAGSLDLHSLLLSRGEKKISDGEIPTIKKGNNIILFPVISSEKVDIQNNGLNNEKYQCQETNVLRTLIAKDYPNWLTCEFHSERETKFSYKANSKKDIFILGGPLLLNVDNRPTFVNQIREEIRRIEYNSPELGGKERAIALANLSGVLINLGKLTALANFIRWKSFFWYWTQTDVPFANVKDEYVNLMEKAFNVEAPDKRSVDYLKMHCRGGWPNTNFSSGDFTLICSKLKNLLVPQKKWLVSVDLAFPEWVRQYLSIHSKISSVASYWYKQILKKGISDKDLGDDVELLRNFSGMALRLNEKNSQNLGKLLWHRVVNSRIDSTEINFSNEDSEHLSEFFVDPLPFADQKDLNYQQLMKRYFSCLKELTMAKGLLFTLRPNCSGKTTDVDPFEQSINLRLLIPLLNLETADGLDFVEKYLGKWREFREIDKDGKRIGLYPSLITINQKFKTNSMRNWHDSVDERNYLAWDGHFLINRLYFALFVITKNEFYLKFIKEDLEQIKLHEDQFVEHISKGLIGIYPYWKLASKVDNYETIFPQIKLRQKWMSRPIEKIKEKLATKLAKLEEDYFSSGLSMLTTEVMMTDRLFLKGPIDRFFWLIHGFMPLRPIETFTVPIEIKSTTVVPHFISHYDRERVDMVLFNPEEKVNSVEISFPYLFKLTNDKTLFQNIQLPPRKELILTWKAGQGMKLQNTH